MLRFQKFALNKLISLNQPNIKQWTLFTNKFLNYFPSSTFSNKYAEQEIDLVPELEELKELQQIDKELESFQPEEDVVAFDTQIQTIIKLNPNESIQNKLKNQNQKIFNFVYGEQTNFSNEQYNKLMQNINNIDFDKVISSKFYHQVKSIQETQSNQLDIGKVEDLIQSMIQRGNFRGIQDKEFKTIIFNEKTQQLVKQFYCKDFFKVNSNYISSQDLVTIISKNLDDSKFRPCLELIKYHKFFLFSDNQDSPLPSYSQNIYDKIKFQTREKENITEFLSQNIESNEFDVLGVLYHLHQISKANLISQNLQRQQVFQLLLKVKWGPTLDKTNEAFSNKLIDLLLFKYRNQAPIQAYLLDAFLNASTYKQALMGFAQNILILSRSQQNISYQSDIYESIIQTQGQKYFDHFIVDQLQKVMQISSGCKNALISLKAGLKEFHNRGEGQRVETQSKNYTYFDEKYFGKNTLIYFNQKAVDQIEIDSFDSLKIFSSEQNIQQAENNFKASLNIQEKNINYFREALARSSPLLTLKAMLEELEKDEDLVIILEKVQKNITGQQVINYNELNQQQAKNILLQLYFALWDDVDATIQLNDEFRNYYRQKFLDKLRFKKSTKQSDHRRTGFTYQARQNYSVINNKNVQCLDSNIQVLSFKNIFLFTSENQTGDKKFKEYLKKSQEIEQEVQIELNKLEEESKKQMDTLKQQQESQKLQDKQAKIFMTKDELQEMKSLLKKKQQEKSRSYDLQKDKQIFSSIKEEPQQQHQQFQEQQESPKNDFWEALLQGVHSRESALDKLEKYFLYLSNTNQTQYEKESIVSSFIFQDSNIFEKFYFNKEDNPSTILQHIFYKPQIFNNIEEDKLQSQPVQELKVSFQSQLGQIEKDYSQYLGKTVFPYYLGNSVYAELLNHQLNQIYKRRQFKKIISHIATFSNPKQYLDDQIVNQIVQICLKEKIGLTLLEISYLFIQKKINISVESFSFIVDALRQFKIISQDIEKLVIAYLKDKGYEQFNYKMIHPLFEQLIKYQMNDKYMFMFEKFKELILNSKPQEVEQGMQLSGEELIKVNEKHKILVRQSLQNYYRQFINQLNDHSAKFFAKLTYDDYVNLKIPLEAEDYKNGLIAYQDDSQKIIAILDDLEKNDKVQLDKQIILIVLKAIQQNPEATKDLFTSLLNKYIYQDKQQFLTDSEITNQIILTFTKVKFEQQYNDFLKYILTKKIRINPSKTRPICYKSINFIKDDIQKSQILGSIEKIFSPEFAIQARQMRNQEIRDQEQIIEKNKYQQQQKQQQKEEEVKPEQRQAIEAVTNNSVKKQQSDNQEDIAKDIIQRQAQKCNKNKFTINTKNPTIKAKKVILSEQDHKYRFQVNSLQGNVDGTEADAKSEKK